MSPFPVGGLSGGAAAVKERRRPGSLVLDYGPSRPHGWQPVPGESVGMTIGGHTTSKEFAFAGRSYRLSLDAFDDPDGSVDPVYEGVPADEVLDFRRTLQSAFGAFYAFRYVGGLRGRGELRVQSYSVSVTPAAEKSPLLYGADLYVTYKPGGRSVDSAVRGLRWIQVVKLTGAAGPPNLVSPLVDNGGRANPYYTTGGSTSINGQRVFNLHYRAALPAMERPEGGAIDLTGSYLAEVFLVHDTGTRNAAGKTVVNVFGGLKYGWRVQERRP